MICRKDRAAAWPPAQVSPSKAAILVLVALGLMLSEYLFQRVNHVESQDAGETAVSLIIAVAHKVIAGLTAGLAALRAEPGRNQ
jgi:hypothetical protein